MTGETSKQDEWVCLIRAALPEVDESQQQQSCLGQQPQTNDANRDQGSCACGRAVRWPLDSCSC